MDYVQHFTRLLQSSCNDFIWATRQIAIEKLNSVPPHRPESWSVARTIFHLRFQEEKVVLPNMRLWLVDRAIYARQDDDLIERYTAFETLMQDEEKAWLQQPDIQAALNHFQAQRTIQIALLQEIDPGIWEDRRATVWGEVTLRWVVTKTYQHSVEHINDVLKPALYWTGLRTTS
ncbi:DinB family protein [Dictyobacter aurantiacus]|uniref:DinB-like domain-containing protein n=1 Tax=Dictyobacter aurantiacus TaxID=1936993 RepID=A0A401ZH60_9CHLR|nr:DinB family protein [Dictyobacter aurantiacus]GCE06224.1 hypothetical protein KDAU_35530 [Dictyobacter aurantiacus]